MTDDANGSDVDAETARSDADTVEADTARSDADTVEADTAASVADAEDTADGDPDGGRGETATAGGRQCPMCGGELYRRHCKYVCPNHGVVMDCADTFHLQRE